MLSNANLTRQGTPNSINARIERHHIRKTKARPASFAKGPPSDLNHPRWEKAYAQPPEEGV